MIESTKRKWLIVAIITSLVPAVLLVQFPTLITLKTLMLYGSAIVGYWGLVLLLWQYILGARQVMSVAFGDIAPVLAIHKWLGKYGSLVIFLHPFMALYFYGESLLYPFIPHIGTEFERAVTLGRIAFIIMLVIWFTSAIVRDRITFRPWKYLHYLAYICVPFVLLHIPNLGSQYLAHQTIRLYFFGLVLVFVAVTLVRVRGWFGIDSAGYEISHHGKLTEGDNLLTLKPIGDMHVEPHQGQYIYLRLGLVSESHPFSVLNYEPKTGELTIAYRLFGMFTNVLSQQPVGTRVSVGGPYGEFMNTLAPNEPTVYISGGIGITPFAYQLQKDAGKRDQWLFAANRSRETAVLLPWLRESLNSRLVTVYSRENSPTLKQNEERGYITASLLEKYLDTPSRYSYYLCGPAPMMQATREMLQNMGISESRIYSETFGW